MSNTTFKEILSSLEQFYTDHAIKFFIPSLKKYVMFKPLSIDQQKRFLDLQLRNNQFDEADFADVYDGVLKESCTEDVDIDTLATVDRAVLALQHRADMDPKLMLDLDDDIIEVDVSDYIAQAKKTKLPAFKKILTYKGIKVQLRMPTLRQDRIYNNLSKDVVNYHDEITDEELEKAVKNSVSELALLAASKYIAYIEVNKKKVNSSDVAPSEFFLLIKSLPGNFLKKMVEFLPNLRKMEADPVTLSQKIGESSRRVSITINSVLFTGL